MKKIKLAVLAGALILSAAGGYANYKMRNQLYYIESHTDPLSSTYRVAASSPSLECGGPGADYVCSVAAASGYTVGNYIPSDECTIASSYAQ